MGIQVSSYYSIGQVMTNDIPTNEEVLVARAIRRDRDAFACLYDNYVDLVFRHICYRISDQREAEDLAQEVFIKAWLAIHKYKQTEAPFKAWLLTIARNLVFDYYKSKKKFVSLEEVEFFIEPAGKSFEEKLEDKEYKNYLKSAIMKLKGDKQRVILMHYIDDFSYAEIARVLNKSEGAIRVIQFRALIDLKQLLNGK
jgi:RNA polymerase sigma-70 factor (ECF subfamily)